MHFNILFSRLRRFHAPLGMLLVLLQRTPVLRVVLPGAEFALSSTVGHVLKCAFGLAAMGTYNSLAGATTFTVISSTGTATGAAKSTFQIAGTVGTPINGTPGVTFSVSGAPGTPKSFGVTDNATGTNYTNTLPPGVSVNPVTGTTAGGAPYFNTNLKLTLNGTPTTAGTYTVRLWASDSTAIAGGNSAYVIATFTIAGGGGGGNVAPAITTQPSSQTVTSGGAVSFTVAASGTPAPTYQWQKGGVNIPGATSATYTIASTVTGDAGSYTAVATNAAGSATSSAATLTVNTAATAPAITTQPLSQTVTAGGSVSFTVAASGSPTPTYQWQKGGVAISGATSATYTIASVVAGDAGSYTAVATNIAGSATSSAATLTVSASATAPAITTQPVSQTVTAGGSVSFTVAASGSPTPTYQWQKGGIAISGATSATYTIASVVAGDAGSYTAVATNSAGSATSSAATLTVSASATAPAITTQPVSQTVTVGGSVSFTVAASGSPTPTYQWQKGGVAISGATSATYTIASVVAGDAGSYTAVATNSAGSATTSAATLTVNAAAIAPAITTQPASQTVTAGNAVSFTVAASGTPSPTYQWQKGGVPISGATNATYSIASTVAGDAGSYTAVATNSAGSATSAVATLTVTAASVAPSITTQPQSITTTVGSSVSLTVTASGTPTPTYQWRKAGVAISGATSATYTIASAVTGNAGSYTVVVTNSAGSVTSAAAVLTVSSPTLPSFTTQPASQAVLAGGSVTFTAVASGAPSPTYQWRKNAVNIAGATAASLTLSNVQAADAATYTVVATNSVGSVTSASAVLSIPVAPTITTQPLSNAVFAGGSATMAVVASGTPVPTYQWQKNGINVSGATSATLALSNIQVTDAGNYAVVVTNSGGTSTSRFARLVVLLPQANAITYASTIYPTGVTAGGNVSLDYLLTNLGTRNWGSNHYLSIRTSSGTFVAFASLIGVNSGENKAVHLSFPAPTTPGTYTYTVQAFEGGVEFFSTQTSFVLTVLAPQANSVTYNATNFAITATPGSNVIFNYNVTNTGTKLWGTNHYLALKNGAGANLGLSSLNGVSSGQSKTVNLSFTAPATPGVYSYAVQATETGVGAFVNQANLTLTVIAPHPNAMVYTPTRSVDNVVPGATVNLRYSLSNSGTGSWGATHYASLRDSNGTYLAFVPLNGVAPAGSATVGFSFVAPNTPGTYTYYVQGLQDGVEFFDTQDLVTITVLATPIGNAAAHNATTFPSVVTAGATVNFTHNVTNRGTKAWGGNHYLSLRDADSVFLGFPTLNGIAPGGSTTLSYSFVAPTTPGIYTYYLQGMEAGIEFFNMSDTLVLIVQ